MAVKDFEAFIRQRAAIFDPNLDVSPGSPFDTQIIQPVVRRLGTDPFTVDIGTFIQERINQAFPDIASKEGDSVTDLLIKPLTLLWDPIVRENRRLARQQSFADPASLTTDEAESLGGNLFASRETGEYARGVARIFFGQPQNISISPINFVTSKNGLHFSPTAIQSISTEEMLLNLNSDNLYYFDINVVAEGPGTQYNISPNELVSIANVPAAVRVENTRRFRSGVNEENAVEFVNRVEQELTERSLVTLRGISAKITRAYPEIRRLNVVGFQDEEMQRDVIKGGGLGEVIASGNSGVAVLDGEGQIKTRRLEDIDANFYDTVGPVGAVSGYVLTAFDAFGAVDVVRDVEVLRIVSDTQLDLVEQIMVLGASSIRWCLRKKELTLSDIPGGILFPNPNGTVTIPDDEIHIGGMADIHLRAASELDEATLVLDSVIDDDPILHGVSLRSGSYIMSGGSYVYLDDYKLDTNYVEGDTTYLALERASEKNYSFQIVSGVDAGVYRIISVTQSSGTNPRLWIYPGLPSASADPEKWRIIEKLTIDLVEPKETKISGYDLESIQGSDVVTTTAGTDFNELAVEKGDTLRIHTGPAAGDYTLIDAPLTPGYTSLQLDRTIQFTQTGMQYTLFKANTDGGVSRPIIRVTSIEVLDTSNQPQGSTIPYAKIVDVRSRAFQNPARGVKYDITDARLGIVSIESDDIDRFVLPAGGSLEFSLLDGSSVYVVLTGGTVSRQSVIDEINAAFSPTPNVAVAVGAATGSGTSGRVGIRPVGEDGKIALIGGTAVAALFGAAEVFTSSDIRSDTIDILGGWSSLDPSVDDDSGLDVVQVLTGVQTGYYVAPYTFDYHYTGSSLGNSSGLAVAGGDITSYTPFTSYHGFAPEAEIRVQVGARSLGSVRCYFLEPTSVTFDANTVFTLTTDDGELNFIPDPTLAAQRIPALPNGDTPTDGSCAKSATPGVFTSDSQDFDIQEIRVGDTLVVEHIPLGGTVVLDDPVSGLVGKSFVYSINGGVDRTLIFIKDDESLASDEVTRQGVVDQINASIGLEICSLTAGNELEFESDYDFTIQATGTCISYILGDIQGTSPALSFLTASAAQRTNRSPLYGSYDITQVTPTQVRVESFSASSEFDEFPATIERQSFKIMRTGTQRVSTSEMSSNVAETGLYYADVELVSEGAGDAWNIEANQQLTVEGYASDGFYLETEDSNLTFSEVEDVKLVISRSILEDGVDDSPDNATQITGRSLQVTYELSATVGSAQSFVSSATERVVCANLLTRHLIPHFIRFDLTYAGGSAEDVIQVDLENLIKDLYPTDLLEVSDIHKIVSNRGANSITNPMDLIAIVYNTDRTVTAQRSNNALGSTRFNTFIPDVLNITRSSA